MVKVAKQRHSPKAGAARHARADPAGADAGPHLLCHRVYALPGSLRLYPLSPLALLCRGRAGQAASTGQHLHQHAASIAYQDTELAFYTTGWAEDNTHITEVKNPRLIETGYQSPQLKLWTLGPDEWLLFLKLPDYAARKKRQRKPEILQLPLPDDGTTATAAPGA